MREPDVCIGGRENPYIRRWHLIRRNSWFNIYLHNILRSDDDRAMHDHPSWNVSIVLRGGYREITPKGSRAFKAGSVVFRAASAAHRLVIEASGGAWTIWISGPKFREWGFLCPNGWVSWKKFTDGNYEGHSIGCGEMS